MALRTAPVSLSEVRARKADKRTEAEELRMEVLAAGSEMVAMSNRIVNALTVGDMHSAMHFAGRLGALGQSYLDPEDDAA